MTTMETLSLAKDIASATAAVAALGATEGEVRAEAIAPTPPSKSPARQLSQKPCRIVALAAFVTFVGFLCFAIQKTIYLVTILTENEKVLELLAAEIETRRT